MLPRGATGVLRESAKCTQAEMSSEKSRGHSTRAQSSQSNTEKKERIMASAPCEKLRQISRMDGLEAARGGGEKKKKKGRWPKKSKRNRLSRVYESVRG